MACTVFRNLSVPSMQMIRKSVETRDWLNTIEPRNVRAVMKRIVEDVTAIDTQVGQLYEEGVHKAHSSGLWLRKSSSLSISEAYIVKDLAGVSLSLHKALLDFPIPAADARGSKLS